MSLNKQLENSVDDFVVVVSVQKIRPGIDQSRAHKSSHWPKVYQNKISPIFYGTLLHFENFQLFIEKLIIVLRVSKVLLK